MEILRNPRINYIYVEGYSDVIEFLKKKKYYSITQDIINEKEELFWFRGHSNTEWGLTPTIFREYIRSGSDIYSASPKIFNKQNEEKNYFITRRQHLLYKNQPALNIMPSAHQIYKWFAILQHYGAQTCLLDWTQKIDTAIYFAIEGYFLNPLHFSSTLPCIWVLRPFRLNKVYERRFKKFFNCTSNRLPTFYDIKNEDSFIDFPCALLPSSDTDRILAQSGTFVIYPLFNHKINRRRRNFIPPLDNHTEAHKFLECIILCNPPQIAHELNVLGYDPFDFYPELSERVRVIQNSWTLDS